MNELWTKNKYINISINILVFLMAVNIMHYGQLLLPIICLLLFVDNRFRFKVNSWFTFIVLCLFAITFCVFSYKLGFYCVMGFTLPMAYYIASNVYQPNIDKVKKIIYLIAIGMAMHLILNFALEVSFWPKNIFYIFEKPSHYDIWIHINAVINNLSDEGGALKVKPTGTSLNYILILSSIYYVVVYEKNKKVKIVVIIFFVISSIYCLALGRRTMLLLVGIVIVATTIYELIYNKNTKVLNLVIILVAVISLFAILYLTNTFNIKSYANELWLFKKFIRVGLTSDRLNLLINSIKLYPSYLWGGQIISNEIGDVVHDLFGDIYNYAGIIPFILMIVYYVDTIMKIIISVNKKKGKESLLFVTLVMCTSIMMFIEPIMTGGSLFLIATVICYEVIVTEARSIFRREKYE